MIFFRKKTVLILFVLFVGIYSYIFFDLNNINDVQMHNSGSSSQKYLFHKTCLDNILLCFYTDFDGNFDYGEKKLYLDRIIKHFDYINENYILDSNLLKKIKKIELRKDNSERRGYATKDYILINMNIIESIEEFDEVLTHELAHIVDLGMIEGKSRKKDYHFTEFNKVVFAVDDISIAYYKLSWESEKTRKASSKKQDFCSKYGMTDPFEDFAECFNLYVNHNSLFRYFALENSILKTKYKYIARLLDNNYLESNIGDIEKFEDNIDKRPWDTTRL